MTETPLLTQTMVSDLTTDIDLATSKAGAAALERDDFEAERQVWAERAKYLTVVRDYMRPRVGRSLSDIREEIQADLEQAERNLAATRARVTELSEHERDLLGYKRILELRQQESDGE